MPVERWFGWHERVGPVLAAIGNVGTSVRYGAEQRFGMRVPDADWDEIVGPNAGPIEVGSMVGAFQRRLLLFPERASGDLAPVNQVT